jgi:hypothetical protein
VDGTLGKQGPGEAVKTAETYAYFGILSYLNKWDFLETGKAKALPKED